MLHKPKVKFSIIRSVGSAPWVVIFYYVPGKKKKEKKKKNVL